MHAIAAPLSHPPLIHLLGSTYWTEMGSASKSACCSGGTSVFAFLLMAVVRWQEAFLAMWADPGYRYTPCRASIFGDGKAVRWACFYIRDRPELDPAAARTEVSIEEAK
jgi:hypothetical protein